jgi:hypothetical protein
MASRYKNFGSDLSLYSVQVHSHTRFEAIPHKWIQHNRSNGGSRGMPGCR